jgi:hypothetical protein
MSTTSSQGKRRRSSFSLDESQVKALHMGSKGSPVKSPQKGKSRVIAVPQEDNEVAKKQKKKNLKTMERLGGATISKAEKVLESCFTFTMSALLRVRVFNI